MTKLGGWVCGALLLALGCSSTVTDTRASSDAATDAIAIDAADPASDASQEARDAHAVDAADDVSRPPIGSNPCAGDRLVDLDRVGLSTEYGVGAVVDHAAAPEVQIDPVGGSCGRIYRPVVLRLRAPRDGRIFVMSTDGEGRTDAAFVRRMGRCDASGAAFTCGDSELVCAAPGVCGRLFGDVHTGEPIDVVVGVTTFDGGSLTPRFGRLAVTLAVLPALPLGAPCRPYATGQDSLCAEGLTCSAVGDPGWIARCVRRTAAPGTCPTPTDRCGDGETCVRGSCVRLLRAGARCSPGGPWTCPSDTQCARQGLSFVCAPAGALGARCRAVPSEAATACDPGLRCDGTGRCSPPVDRLGVCDGETPCDAGSRCAPGNPPRCVPPGYSGGPCILEGDRRRCAEGLQCGRTDDVCVPTVGEGDRCGLSTRDQPECGEGLVCAGNVCTRTGHLGDPCSPVGRQVDCPAPLTCAAYVCSTPPTEGQRCTTLRACAQPLRCSREIICRVPGGLRAPCRVEAPRCDDGLGCSRDRCVPVSPIGTPCPDGGDGVCTEPLQCGSRLGGPAGCFTTAVPCADGCPTGSVCRDGECVVDGRCDRSGATPQPCGAGRYCVAVGGGAVSCVAVGARDGLCRMDQSAPCDDGLICAADRCVPLLGDGAACLSIPGRSGVCGSGLACSPPNGCVPGSPTCAWPEGSRLDGTCRPSAPAGTLHGDCQRSPDGRARCEGSLACEPSTLRCAPVASPDERCDALTRLCPAGTRCVFGSAPRCQASGGRGLPCRRVVADLCDAGLVCGPRGCQPVARDGEACELADSGRCENGTQCLAGADGSPRCTRVGIEGRPCAGPSRDECAPGAACVGGVCVAALAEGAACTDARSRCGEGMGCGPGVASPRVCRRLRTLGAPCSSPFDCGRDLVCQGECVPLRYAGEACDPARRADGCEQGFTCEGGRCREPRAGEPCASGRCAVGLRCIRDQCVRPRDPGEACSLIDDRTPCRDDSACASEVCRVLGSRGALCRRGPGALPCDAGLRCDVVADRCVP